MHQNNTFLIALGGNLSSPIGPPDATLRAALDLLTSAGVQVVAVSSFFKTPCFPAGAGPDYVNAAARLEAAMTPVEMLDLLHKIEAELGRERVQRWGMRTLDMDLIAVGDSVLPDAMTQTKWRALSVDQQVAIAPDQLILPHPRLHERAFVLIPLSEIAPDWVHPLLGLSTTQMCSNLSESDRKAVVPM
jgi:2-amino-4-hydroxy-6-hydroxymethyldihydropteridine diphosphokinase